MHYLMRIMKNNLKNHKCDIYCLLPMFNKHTTALCTAVISSIVVASVFALGFVEQQASGQGNQTAGGSTNQSSGAAGSNRASGNATGGGTAAGGSTGGPPY
jgi:hypothetical protein